MAKTERKPIHTPAAVAYPPAAGSTPPTAGGRTPPQVHLKKEEMQRVEVLKVNVMKKRGVNNFDVPAVLELIYLRVVGRVPNRGPVESELKELKSLLDQASTKATEILDKSAKSNSSK